MISGFDWKYWENEIIQLSSEINQNIILTAKDRNKFSSTTISDFRHFIEAVVSYIFTKKYKGTYHKRYEVIEESLKYVKNSQTYKFIFQFHVNAQITVGHGKQFGEYAERIILNNFKYLVKIKNLLINEYNLHILPDLTMLPLNLDDSLIKFYREIGTKVNLVVFGGTIKKGTNYFYIQKCKTVYVDGMLFYEYTLTNALDSISKFDRFIAYSKCELMTNYAVRCTFDKKEIEIIGKKIEILIINNYWVSIRPCEFEKLGIIFNQDKTYTRTAIYDSLMDFIRDEKVCLAKILLSKDEEYDIFLKSISKGRSLDVNLMNLLNIIRSFLKKKIIGYNSVVYLLTNLNNSILQSQIALEPNKYINNLRLKSGVLLFENTPFSASLIKHNPDIFKIIDFYNYEDIYDQLYAREIQYQSSQLALLYNQDLINDELIQRYNSRNLYYDHMRIGKFGKNVFIKQNEENTIFVLKRLLRQSRIVNFNDYKEFAKSMIKQKNISLDDNNKEEAIVNMFDKGSLYCIYGSAGTGKSTLISKELSIMENVKVLCLCNTHSALENLKNRINNRNFYFSTISSYLSRLNKEVENWDILVIDECSNVPTRDMADLLKRISVKLILLAGDIFQLPSIEFGNWYALIRAFLDKHSFIDLDYTFRTNNEMLLRVWKDVRLIKSTIASRLTSYRISKRISSEIFNVGDEDEVILCLNYDGLYGINNINKLLQINNPNPVYTWRQYSFKVGDPILFNENNRFKGYIYNNLKGVIQNIKINENRSIVFEILVDTTFNTLIDYSLYGFKVLKNEENSKSLIEISVSNCSETDFDKDTNLNAIVPFQIAYAISIHKAQGLEFNSVKIVITNEIEERISHNVFYTAITRAKEKLSIYWSPESEKNIISSLKKHNINIDASILSQKLNLELKKQ